MEKEELRPSPGIERRLLGRPAPEPSFIPTALILASQITVKVNVKLTLAQATKV